MESFLNMFDIIEGSNNVRANKEPIQRLKEWGYVDVRAQMSKACGNLFIFCS